MTRTAETRPPDPVPDYADQDTRFSQAFDILREGITRHAFPGASVAITYQGRLVVLKGLGHFTYDEASSAVQPDTIYDLASVTKVLATTTAAMILYDRGLLDLDAPLEKNLELMKCSPDTRWAQITGRMLLSHSSGVVAYSRLFEGNRGPDIITCAASIPLEADPGSRALYSDIGFLLMEYALARINRWEQLDAFCNREIFAPLGMKHTAFNPPAEWRSLIPPTEEDKTFRKKLVQGEVHDENAWAAGGVAGHAGLFAPAADVARFAECMLAGGRPILRPETVALFTKRQDSPPGTSRALGWDTPSQPSQSGRYFSPRSFGHLGYTGTSLWIDPERRLSVTLLTNRTWPDRSSQLIKEVRPRFHDAVVEALESQP